MQILYLLIPIALGVMAVAAAAFLWAIKSGQYDDMEGPAHRILMDDDDPLIPHPKTEADLKQGQGSDNINNS